jgi:integrase
MPSNDDERTRRPNGASTVYYSDYDKKWHGRVTVGVRDDGKPDRRHVKRSTKADAIKAVRKLEQERESGQVRRPGRPWTVEQWLAHWVEHIAAPTVRDTTLAGYRTAVYKHLIPGIGAHRIDRLEPDHLEKLYAKIMAEGGKPGTAHQVHRTEDCALRGHEPRAHPEEPRETCEGTPHR